MINDALLPPLMMGYHFFLLSFSSSFHHQESRLSFMTSDDGLGFFFGFSIRFLTETCLSHKRRDSPHWFR